VESSLRDEDDESAELLLPVPLLLYSERPYSIIKVSWEKLYFEIKAAVVSCNYLNLNRFASYVLSINWLS
jgi:hypothetical protein